MFRVFATLVDPFQPHALHDGTAPPAGAWRFLTHHLRPLRFVMAASLALTVLSAALEVRLIGYAGRLVDTLSATAPKRLWTKHGIELLVIAALILVARPLFALLRESLDDIAWATLKDAPILILDEATSALDTEVEAAIQGTLYSAMEGKTVIAIAHHLSTIAHMDRVVVLDAGRIVKEGTHDALLARGGIYAALWARQSGGFLGNGSGTPC